MQNHEINHDYVSETLTQIGSYFDDVDNCMSMGDTNKRYVPVSNPCYSTSCPIKAGHPTTFIISPTGDNTADVYNGFIYANLKFKLRINQATSKFNPDASDTAATDKDISFITWHGFKDSMDSVEKYEILCNGISVYQQPYAIEESFITSCGIVENCKRTDVYSKSRHKDSWNEKYGNKCGVEVCWNTGVSITNEGVIPLKIDLRRFLPLSNIKYLPAFTGKVELKIWFSTKGMVYCPIDPTICFKSNRQRLGTVIIPPVTNEFTPIGEEITMLVDVLPARSTSSSASVAPVTSLVAGQRTIEVLPDFRLEDGESVVNCFGISDAVYNSLVQKYSEMNLTFPTQTLSVYPCNGILNGCGTTRQVNQTITPRFVESIFLLFPLNANYKTVYKNPCFESFQINCGGYGSVPATTIKTYEDPRLIEFCQNAMNLNTDTECFSNEVCRSLVEQTGKIKTGYESKDATNFFIGFATEPDRTFQQGHTSNVSIVYNIKVENPAKGTDKAYYAENVESSPIMCMLVDSVISFKIRPNGAPSDVVIGAYDITSPEVVRTD